MGAWGTGIRQDDFVCDVEGTFKDHLKDGKSILEASKCVHEQFAEALDDRDHGPLFWLALADVQWTYGDLDPLLLQRVGEIMEAGAGMEPWGEPSDKLYKQRKAAIAKFHEKISHPNPKPSRLPKRILRKPRFNAGDCLSIQLNNGQFGAALVLATDSSDPEYAEHLVAELSYLSDSQPTIDVFTNRNWLKLTHHNWNGDLNIVWYGCHGLRKMSSRLSVVGSIPIRADDPNQSKCYANWQMLGTQVLRQHDWDARNKA